MLRYTDFETIEKPTLDRKYNDLAQVSAKRRVTNVTKRKSDGIAPLSVPSRRHREKKWEAISVASLFRRGKRHVRHRPGNAKEEAAFRA